MSLAAGQLQVMALSKDELDKLSDIYGLLRFTFISLTIKQRIFKKL